MPTIDSIAALLNKAPNGALAGVLQEQDDTGLWQTAHSSSLSLDNRRFAWEGRVNNIGLHTFIVERLLIDWPNIGNARRAAVKGLRAILSHAVEVEGKLMWRWLKVPTRPDYVYDPDYDDTARAVAVLNIGKQLLSKGEFARMDLEIAGRALELDLARSAARDLCALDEALLPSWDRRDRVRAVSTFVGGLSAKANNTADPIVNANVLYALAASGFSDPLSDFRPLVDHIVKYLSEVVRRKDQVFHRFSEFSHYYFSPCLLTYLCTQVRRVAPSLIPSEIINSLAEGIIRYSSQHDITSEEAAWVMASLQEADVDNLPVIHTLAGKILQGFDVNLGIVNPSAIYQHKRLGDVFGSRAFSTLICLEGLRSFMMLMDKNTCFCSATPPNQTAASNKAIAELQRATGNSLSANNVTVSAR